MQACKNVRMTGMGKLALAGMLALMMAQGAAGAADTVLPEKTRMTLQLNNPLSTRVNSEGDAFTAYVTTPIVVGERMVIPKGSVVSGTISRVLRPGRFKGKAVLNLMFQSIVIPGLGQFPIAATLTGVSTQGRGAVHAEGTVTGESGGANDAGKVLVPGLAGAGIGAIAGGARGAAIGSGVGAAMGLAGVFATRGHEIEIRKGAMLEITLDRPLAVPPDESAAAFR